MLVRKQYIFPRPEIEGMKAVETKFLELSARKRNGDRLDPEEADYYDYANNELMSCE